MKLKFSIINNLKTFIVLIFAFTIYGCVSIKPASVKSGKNLFETFYVGEDGTQYFIKPLNFLNSQNKEELRADFTFRYKNEVKDSVTINFSLLSPKNLKNIDSLVFSNTNHKIVSTNVELLFNEKASKLFKSRFSTKVSLLDFNQMFENNDWKIITHKFEDHSTYTSDKRTKKAIKKLRDEIFILF